MQAFRVTHPFHPDFREQFELVEVRGSGGGRWIITIDSGGRRRGLPAAWTDLVPPDPFVALSGGRSAFRVCDLVALTILIENLEGP